jgi:hypothetical protein
MRAEIRYDCFCRRIQSRKNGGLLPKALTGNTLAIFSSTYTVATIPRFGPAWRLLAAALLDCQFMFAASHAVSFRAPEAWAKPSRRADRLHARTPRGLLRSDHQFVRIERARYYQELFQIEAAGFRDEEGAESGEGVGYAASKEGPGESAIFAQASDEQWSQGAE